MPEAESHCPICDTYVGRNADRWARHRCREAVYRGIDAANTKAEDETAPVRDTSEWFYWLRLQQGFEEDDGD